MNKMTCGRSNFKTKTSTGAINKYPSYRMAGGKTLIVLAMCSLVCSLAGSVAAWADDNDPWPEQVYYPQKVAEPEAPAKTTTGKASPATANKTEKPAKEPISMGKLWPFKAKAPKPQQTFNVVPPKPSAQKADPPPSPYPLLRLPMPIVTEQGVVQPGFYLIKPDMDVENETNGMPGAKGSTKHLPAKPELNADHALLLTRQNQVMARIFIHPSSEPDEMAEPTGTASPLTIANPNLAPILKVQAQLAADQKTLRLLVRSGNQRYESDPFPVGTDSRRMLTF